MSSNFIIILGGPGKFVSCDKAHDQTWTNYLVPIQLASMRSLFNIASGEKVHLLAYHPAYNNRWVDDSVITATEKKQSDGAWLHSNRKSKADKVIGVGARNYLHRIQQIATKQKMSYKAIKKPSELWSYIQKLPDASISRVFYSGHAAQSGLMLSLDHDTGCTPVAQKSDMVLATDIRAHRSLASKFSSTHNQVSKFLGCYTHDFAKEWNKTFKVKTEGAVKKVDFGVVDRDSKYSNVIERIEKTSTSVGAPGWSKFHTVPKPKP